MSGKRGSLSRLRVLRALLDDANAPHYGLSLIRRSGVGAGSLYPILAELEEQGWVEGAWEDIDEVAAARRKRRYYALTDPGGRDARALLTEMAELLTPPAPEPRARRAPRLVPA
jgi:PadR family transcriptional regulator PadR